VIDLVLVLGTIAFFAIATLYVLGCDALIARDRRLSGGKR